MYLELHDYTLQRPITIISISHGTLDRRGNKAGMNIFGEHSYYIQFIFRQISSL